MAWNSCLSHTCTTPVGQTNRGMERDIRHGKIRYGHEDACDSSSAPAIRHPYDPRHMARKTLHNNNNKICH